MLEIIAKDGVSPSKSSNVIVNVIVNDLNDNEPRFNQSSFSFDVSEDASLTTMVGRVFANDKDEGLNGEIVFTITNINT